MSRRNYRAYVLELKINGFALVATRESWVTPGADPTRMTKWTSPRFELTEFFGDVSGSLDDEDLPINDRFLVELYGWLEGVVSVKELFEHMDDPDVPDFHVEV